MRDHFTEAERNWIKQQLRRISYRWKDRTAAKQAARVARGWYKCAACGNGFPASQVQLDHIVPVIDPKKGFTTWDSLIKRLFVRKPGWQVLCKPCHTEKSNNENVTRRSRSKKK